MKQNQIFLSKSPETIQKLHCQTDLTSCKIAIVYASLTGNTEELIEILSGFIAQRGIEADVFATEDFQASKLVEYDALIIGTYTWGNGEIPPEMLPLYRQLEVMTAPGLVSGVCGTGDSLYPNYCGAVNEFRDLLNRCSNLAATLKVELLPQRFDHQRCLQFVDRIIERIKSLDSSFQKILS